MKKTLSLLLLFVLASPPLVFGESSSNENLGADKITENLVPKENQEEAPVIEAISLEQLLTDGIRREGDVTVAGPILELDVKYSPFDDSVRKLELSIGDKGRSLEIALDNADDVEFNRLQTGDIIAITGETVLLRGLTGIIRGDFVTAEFIILDYEPRENGSEEINVVTVKEYFDDMLRFGAKKVTIRGQIMERSMTGAGEVLFVLADSGREINAYSDSQTFNIAAHESELRAAKVGSIISLYGSFLVEHSAITMFSFEKIE